MKKLFLLLPLAMGLAACGSNQSSNGPTTYLLDELENRQNIPDAGWDDLKAALPAPPTADGVLPIDPGRPLGAHFRFGIDPQSISIAPGDIVRYTLRAESDRGAVNISYETVRCNTREWRVVAYYQPDKGWVRAQNDDWQPYRSGTVQGLLRSEVFCVGGGAATVKPAGLADRLRHWEQYVPGLASMP